MQFGTSPPTALLCAVALLGGALLVLLWRHRANRLLEEAILSLARGESFVRHGLSRIGARAPVAAALDRIGKALHAHPPRLPEISLLAEMYAGHAAKGEEPDAPAFYLAMVGYEYAASMRRAFGPQFAESLTAALMRHTREAMPRARIGRIGATSFELAFETGDEAGVEQALADLRARLERPFDLDGQPFELLISIGAARAVSSDHDLAMLTARAEQALVQAGVQPQRIVVQTEPTDPEQAERAYLSRELARALDRNEIYVVYQPKLRLRSGEVDGAEALLRWEHPASGLVPPNTFIPLAEQSGEIRALTLWVLRRVVMDQKRLALRGWPLSIHINISGRLLTDAAFAREACSIVGGASAAIGFEITETAIIDDQESALANLNRFAEMGITISIDDYGAGLSSLSYLKQLPARELKIDKAFISEMTTSHRDPLIVRSTIDLAHALEMNVTAEGVENQATLALLTVMGCDIAQGFLISPGVRIDELERFLKKNSYLGDGADGALLHRSASFWGRA